MATPADESFEEVFDELFRRAVRLARRIVGDSASAEDIAAEAMARAYARWPQIHALPWRDGWVLRVTTNLAIDTARIRSRPWKSQIIESHADGADAVAVQLALLAALRALPRRQREAIGLRYLADFGEAEVAETLGVSAGTVKTHLHRGVATLRRRLGTTFEENYLAFH